MFVYWVARHLPVNRLSVARQRSARPCAIAGCLCLGDFLPNSARPSRGWEPRTNNPIPLLPDHFFDQVQIATEDSSPLMSESIKGALWYLPQTRISPDSNLISGTQLPSATPDQHISLLIHWRKFNQPHSELTPAIVVGHPVRLSLNSPNFAFYTVPTFYQPCRTPFPPDSLNPDLHFRPFSWFESYSHFLSKNPENDPSRHSSCLHCAVAHYDVILVYLRRNPIACGPGGWVTHQSRYSSMLDCISTLSVHPTPQSFRDPPLTLQPSAVVHPDTPASTRLEHWCPPPTSANQ